ncbi:Cof-type HAD-IIB family hydrolase [Spirochaetia bacterium]|nr:Cof-type HAD-IIB family hydrolase [Spirochaetia bacterium]
MAKMIVMDLDGTLLTDDKNISDYTRSILEKCKKNGIKIVIATARSEKSAKRCIELIKPDIMILNGGALVINNNGENIYKKLLSIKTSNGIINECIHNKNVGDLTVETDRDYYVSYKNPAYHPDYMHGKYYDFSKPLSQETYKITVEIFDKETALNIENKFKECKLISFSGENWHRFAHKEGEKMTAIEAISKNKNIPISDIIAFGDDYNDIEMIKKCGTGVAMENGINETKEIAKYICGNNNEDGVGKWIEKNIL